MHHTIKNVSQSRNMVALASLVFAASEQIWLVITDEAIKLFNSKIIRTSVSDLNDRKRYDDRKQ